MAGKLHLGSTKKKDPKAAHSGAGARCVLKRVPPKARSLPQPGISSRCMRRTVLHGRHKRVLPSSHVAGGKQSKVHSLTSGKGR